MIEQSVQPTPRRFTWAIPLLVVVVLTAAGIWIWSTSTERQANTAPAPRASVGVTQTNEGGQVTVEATLQESGAAPIFNVAMNTHAVNLDGYDLNQLAVLRIDGGREVQPASWEAPKGGHHRSGTLTFPADGTDGTPLIGPGTHMIELIIRDVSGVPERSFRWRLER
jgi:hypothetical protein